MTGRFEGQVAIVTGAAGAIGSETAGLFAGGGAKLVLVDLPGSPLEETLRRVEEAGAEGIVVEADVRDTGDVEAYVEAARSAHGGVDILFNNAGVEGYAGNLEDTSEDAWERVFDVNAKGVWLGMKSVVPAFRERGGGVIVNTASTLGLGASPGLVSYGATKHAVVGLTRTAAKSWGRDGIRVNAVAPGPVDTPLLHRSMAPGAEDAMREMLISQIPLGRLAEPSDVASMVSFLCSRESSYLTGGVYVVDGGMTA